jgi:hypothetical protein
MAKLRVENFMEDIQSIDVARHDLIQDVRSLIVGLGSDIGEEIKYGGILFSAGRPFCGIFSYANHISLEFGDGAALPDKFKVLEGSGKQRRHIKLSGLEQVSSKHLQHYLGLALKALREE